MTFKELVDLFNATEEGIQFWVKLEEKNSVYSAILDEVPGVGYVAVWCAGGRDTWLTEATYGKTWTAHLTKPEIKYTPAQTNE